MNRWQWQKALSRISYKTIKVPGTIYNFITKTSEKHYGWTWLGITDFYLYEK